MFSVVCVYNHRKILHDCLLKSLKAQTVDYELILIDNRKKRFRSAAQALNYGGKRARGQYIMFIHQDMILKSEKVLQDIETALLGGLR